MRVLVLGGTVFLSRAVAAEALRRGHDVVCAARGTSGTIPARAELVKVDRNAPDGLAALVGERFDAVVDVARMSVGWVRQALRTLGDGAGHWTFVSSCSVYADQSVPGQTTDAALLDPLEDDPEAVPDPDRYGGIKVASEIAVREALGDRAFVPRAGLITGPGDLSGRFGYWPVRLARGGRVAVPGRLAQLTQQVDVRDLATWIVCAGEQGLTGTFDGVDTPRPLGELLGELADAVAPPGTELVPVPEKVLAEAGVGHWAGPKSLPLWLPESHTGMCGRDVSATLAAGLRPRPVSETARDSLVYELAKPPTPPADLLVTPGIAGLSAEEESDLLARLP